MPQCKNMIDGFTEGNCHILTPELWQLLEGVSLASALLLFAIWVMCRLFGPNMPDGKSHF